MCISMFDDSRTSSQGPRSLGRSCLGLMILLAFFSACSPSRAPSSDEAREEPQEWFEGSSERGTYLVRWRPSIAPVPNNEPFVLDLWVESTANPGMPVEGLEIHVHADMPDHRHGMARAPKTSAEANGRYHVRGMLLHMSGFWRLYVDIIDDGVLERAVFPLELS